MLKVLIGDAPQLRVVCKPIDFSVYEPSTIVAAFEVLLSTLNSYGGIGIAANQIGGDKRMIVVCVDRSSDPIFMVNPVITQKADTQSAFEGCLSLTRSNWGIVTRCKRIKVDYYTPDGELKKLKAHGLLAACIQHEIDHLDGKLLTDRIKEQK